MMKRTSEWRSISAVPASILPQNRMLTGKSFLTAARRMRSKPGSSGARFDSLVMMMRMPTVPGVFFQSAMTSATARSSGLTGLTSANPVRMGLLHLHRIAGVVLVHRKGGNIDRAVDAHLVHRRHHLVAGDVRRPVGHAVPGPLRRVRRVGMDLGIDDRHRRRSTGSGLRFGMRSV